MKKKIKSKHMNLILSRCVCVHVHGDGDGARSTTEIQNIVQTIWYLESQHKCRDRRQILRRMSASTEQL